MTTQVKAVEQSIYFQVFKLFLVCFELWQTYEEEQKLNHVQTYLVYEVCNSVFQVKWMKFLTIQQNCRSLTQYVTRSDRKLISSYINRIFTHRQVMRKQYDKININIERERKYIVMRFSSTLSPFWQTSAQEMHSPQRKFSLHFLLIFRLQILQQRKIKNQIFQCINWLLYARRQTKLTVEPC